MNTHAILKLSILFCFYILIPIKMDLIDGPGHTTGCTGTLRLYTHSLEEITISSSSYQGIRRNRQFRMSSTALRSKSRHGFATVSTEGNCCWKVREKPNGRGSNEYLNPAFNFYEPGWAIRSFDLVEPCQRV